MPRHFHNSDAIATAIRQVIEDSHARTGGFEEAAEVIADLFCKNENKIQSLKKNLNGSCIQIFLILEKDVVFRYLYYQQSHLPAAWFDGDQH